MVRENAINFLRMHQPMPPDDEWTQDMIDGYFSAIDALDGNVEFEVGQLLFGSLNQDTCHGRAATVVQIIADSLSTDDIELIIERFLSVEADEYLTTHALWIIHFHGARDDVYEKKSSRRFIEGIRTIVDSDVSNSLKMVGIYSLYWLVSKKDVPWIETEMRKATTAGDQEVFTAYEEVLEVIKSEIRE